MQENDAGAKTIREYLIKLLKELWSEGESFSGKRPFGNSGWELELYHALANNDAINYTVWEDYSPEEDHPYDRIASYDSEAANKLIFKAINELGEK